MRKLTENGIIEAENKAPFTHEYIKSHNKDLHYLAFDRQLSGFSPLGYFFYENEDIRSNEKEIIDALIAKKEVCSLYPKAVLTLYPIEKVEEGNGYNIVLENIEKHFADILYLNDEVYKTKYMFVDFGHGANNLQNTDNYNLVLESLRKLKQKSKILQEIFID